MRRTPVVIVVFLLAAAGIAVFLYQRSGFDDVEPIGDEPLEPLAESPRPPVSSEPTKTTLAPMPSSLKRAGPTRDRAAFVRERNELAREHRRLVAAYEAGMVSIANVEAAEMRLLDARHRLGEIDRVAWHRSRAVLRARTVERAKLLAEAGMVPASDSERAHLGLELELMLAGDGDGYAASRDAFFRTTRERQQALVEAGRLSAKAAQEELERLEAEFPTADVAKAQDR